MSWFPQVINNSSEVVRDICFELPKGTSFVLQLIPGFETFDSVVEVLRMDKGGFGLKEKLKEIEKKFIQNALEKSGGNVSKTARLLNMQRTTLIEKINKYKI